MFGEFLLHGARQRQPVDVAGQHHVGEDEIDRLAGVEHSERFARALDRAGAVIELFEQRDGDGAHVRIVLDHQNGFALAAPLRRLLGGRNGGDRRAAARHIDRDGGAAADFARDRDRAAGLLREAIDLRQAEPGAFAGRLGGEERLEDLATAVRPECRCRCRRR